MLRTTNFRPVSLPDKPPFTPALPENVAHVWTADLAAWSEEGVAALSACLDTEELARANRFHFARDRRHFIVTPGLLRRFLADYLGTQPTTVCFRYGLRGKPEVSSPATSLRFNLSHSHGRAVFVFMRSREVGIDVEAGARLGDDWPGLMRRVFSAREQEEISSLSPTVQRTAFLNGWTRKEAYLKATGLGITDGLQSIEVTLDPERVPALLAAPVGSEWTIHDLRTDNHYAAALIVGGSGSVEIRRFDAPERW